MKLTLKLSDIEVSIEDPEEKDRTKLIGEALGCVDVLVQDALIMHGSIASQQESAEDQTSILTKDTKQLNPDIHNLTDNTMTNMYR